MVMSNVIMNSGSCHVIFVMSLRVKRVLMEVWWRNFYFSVGMYSYWKRWPIASVSGFG